MQCSIQYKIAKPEEIIVCSCVHLGVACLPVSNPFLSYRQPLPGTKLSYLVLYDINSLYHLCVVWACELSW
jgi:hypothetical protein